MIINNQSINQYRYLRSPEYCAFCIWTNTVWNWVCFYGSWKGQFQYFFLICFNRFVIWYSRFYILVICYSKLIICFVHCFWSLRKVFTFMVVSFFILCSGVLHSTTYVKRSCTFYCSVFVFCVLYFSFFWN